MDRVVVTINGNTVFDNDVEDIAWRKSGDSFSMRAGPKRKADPEARAKFEQTMGQLGDTIGKSLRSAVTQQNGAPAHRLDTLPRIE